MVVAAAGSEPVVAAVAEAVAAVAVVGVGLHWLTSTVAKVLGRVLTKAP